PLTIGECVTMRHFEILPDQFQSTISSHFQHFADRRMSTRPSRIREFAQKLVAKEKLTFFGATTLLG
ncbi:MAG: hypothetical protein KDA90_24465, partial [Planctomycetaceae bacterium]|nr:hypothetical protein [Planctomycetaceae bacterium]